MFIDLDDEHVIHSKNLIAILDIQLKKSSIKLTNLLEDKKHQNELIGDPTISKSIIITDDYIYYSSYSPVTLKKKFNMTDIINKIDNY